MNDYDLVIVGTGIWESIRPSDCKMNLHHFNKEQNLTLTFTTSLEMKIDILLDLLAVKSSSNLQIILQTPGFEFKRPNDQVMLIGKMSYPKEVLVKTESKETLILIMD